MHDNIPCCEYVNGICGWSPTMLQDFIFRVLDDADPMGDTLGAGGSQDDDHG